MFKKKKESRIKPDTGVLYRFPQVVEEVNSVQSEVESKMGRRIMKEIITVNRFIGGMVTIGFNASDPPTCESCKKTVDPRRAILEVNGGSSGMDYLMWCNSECRKAGEVIEGEIILPRKFLNAANPEKKKWLFGKRG